MLTLLRRPLYRRLLFSYGISSFGRWFDLVAMMIIFGYVWEADPLIIALIPVAYAVPGVLFSQFAAVWADRVNKVRLMQAADIGTAFLTIGLIFAPGAPSALLLLFFRACFTVVHFPSQQALVKEVVPAEFVVKAVTLNGALNEASKIAGPFLGGAVAAAFSPQICLAVNAAAHFFSAAVVHKAGAKAGAPVSQAVEIRSPFWQNWKEGWKFLLQRRALWLSIGFLMPGMFAVQMVDIQIPVILRQIAPQQPELIGWIMGASGAGALIMMTLLQRLKSIRAYGKLLGVSMVFLGAGFGGITFYQAEMSFLIPILCGLMTGFGVGVFSIVIGALLQQETTEDTISRISGIFNSLSNTVVLAAPITGGVLMGMFPPVYVYLCVSGVLILLGISGILLQKKLWGNTSDEDENLSSQESNICADKKAAR